MPCMRYTRIPHISISRLCSSHGNTWVSERQQQDLITRFMSTWGPVAICQTLGRGRDYTTSEQVGPLQEPHNHVLHHVFGILGGQAVLPSRVVKSRGRISMYASPSSFGVTLSLQR
jgi:hypothetical protein